MADEKLRDIIRAIFDTHLDTIIDCDTCSRQFHCLAEMVAQGADAAALLPAVEEHLRCCPDCREEFNFLVAMLKADMTESASRGTDAGLDTQPPLPTLNPITLNED
jgi:predicted anti-sigma-YlaC factor YlaD